MAMRNEFLVCLGMLLNGCFALDCTLPKLDAAVDWDMLPGAWYETFTPHDPVASCLILTNMRSDRKGGAYVEFEAVTNVTRSSETHYAMPQRFTLQEDGTYLFDPRYQSIFIDQMESLSKKESAGPMKKSINAELPNVSHASFAFWTDYENYFFGMRCINNGKYIWVFGRNNYATEADMEIVRSELARFGDGWENAYLYPSGCTNFNFFDDIE